MRNDHIFGTKYGWYPPFLHWDASKQNKRLPHNFDSFVHYLIANTDPNLHFDSGTVEKLAGALT